MRQRTPTEPKPLAWGTLTTAARDSLRRYLEAGARRQFPGRQVQLQHVERDALGDVPATRLDSDAGEDSPGEALKVA